MQEQALLFAAIGGVVILWYLRGWLANRGIGQYTRKDVEEKNDVTLLDVRTPAERKAGSIRGSVHIPLDQLARRAGELKKYAQTEIVCFCQTGSRSGAAARTLKKAGYKTGNLKGGIAQWNFDGLA